MRDVLLTAQRVVVVAVDVASDRRGRIAVTVSLRIGICVQRGDDGSPTITPFAPFCASLPAPLRPVATLRLIASVHWRQLFQLGEGGHFATRQRPHERKLGIIPRRFSPRFDGTAGDAPDVVSRLARQRAMMIEPLADAVGRRHCRPRRQARDCQNAGAACAKGARKPGSPGCGSNGSAKPNSTATLGMNWAMPNAPTRLTASRCSSLSCQIRLAKNGTGRSLSCAEASSMCAKTIDGFRSVVVRYPRRDRPAVLSLRWQEISTGRTASSVWS